MSTSKMEGPIGPNEAIKVTKIESFVLKNSWVFVKISTDAGIAGWGEMLKDDAKACAAGAEEVSSYLVGQDPRRVAHHWQAIHRGAFYRGGPIKTAIISGIDQALWDIAGKCYGVPVYKLLGGPTRDKVRVYGHVSEDTGINAMKVGPQSSRQAFKYIENALFVDEVVERFAALREQHGYGVDIAIDFHGAVQPPTALLLVKALEPYKPWFYEEIVQALNKPSTFYNTSSLLIWYRTMQQLYAVNTVLLIIRTFKYLNLTSSLEILIGNSSSLS